jgi:hypothetical protein
MKRAWAIIAVAAVAGLIADVLVDSTPGQTAGTGFFGCVLIVYASKWLGRRLLQRPEAYYRGGDA